MKILIKKPELLSYEYLIQNGKENDTDVWEDMNGYVTKDNKGETIPFCGIVYCVDPKGEYNNGIDSYFICDETGLPVVSVIYFPDGTLETYCKRYIDHKTLKLIEYEYYSYISNDLLYGILSSYEKKFEDGIVRKFVFGKNNIKRFYTDFGKYELPSEYEFFDKETLKRQYFYYSKEINRNLFWNKNGIIEYDAIKFEKYYEMFSFNDFKYELSVYIDESYSSIKTILETQNGRVIHSVYEYELYPGKIMSEMKYSETEKKYHSILKDIDGTILLETGYSEITGERYFREYNKDGSLKTEFTLEKVSNKTDILSEYEFEFE